MASNITSSSPRFPTGGLPVVAGFWRWVRVHVLEMLPSFSWISPGVLGHGARTSIAAVIALFLAYALQLESPQIAMLTVLLVSNPMSGAVISKSLWRIAATVIGASVGLALMAGFGQSPEAFMLLYSLWLGGCVVMATRLRRFRSYAAALSGYTLALTTMGALDNPLHTFDIATARIGAITIGVMCKMVVSGVIWPVTAAERLDSRLKRVGGEVAQCVIDALSVPEIGEKRLPGLLMEIQTLDDMASYASVESAASRAQGQAARAASAALYGLLSEIDPIRRALGLLPSLAPIMLRCLTLIAEDDLVAFRAAAAEALWQARSITHHHQTNHDDLHGGGSHDDATLTGLPSVQDPAHLAAANRLSEALMHMITVATAQDTPRAATLAVEAPDAPDGPPGAAIIIGIRTVLGTGLAAIFWMATQFPAGPTMISWGSLVYALLASRTNPLAASVQTLRAALWAAVIGLAYTFLLLPRISDFLPLALVLMPMIMISAIIASRPGQADFGTFLPIFIVIMIAPGNPMKFDLGNYLNTALAVVIGTGWTALIYRIILPVNPHREAARLLAHVRADVRSLTDITTLPSMPGWEFRQYNRLARLAAWQKEKKSDGGELAVARRQLDIGRGLIAMRHLLAGPGLPPDQQRQGALIVSAITRLSDAPDRLASFLRRSARRLAAASMAARQDAERRSLMALAACCHQIADAMAVPEDPLAPPPPPPEQGNDPKAGPGGGPAIGTPLAAGPVPEATAAVLDGVSETLKVPA